MTTRQKLEAEIVEVKKFSIKAEFKALFEAEKKNNILPNMVGKDFYLLAEKKFISIHNGKAYSDYECFRVANLK